MTLATTAKKLERIIVDNAPAILTALGVGGVVTTTFFATRASFKAARIIDDKEYLREKQGEPPLDIKEKVRLTWMLYIPTVSSGLSTVACVVGANHIGAKRTIALATAYSLSDTAFTEYKAKVAEKFGDSKEQKVRDELAQDRLNANPISTREVIITGGGEVLCWDTITGRYFLSTVETLRKAQNDINQQILQDMYASLHEFFDLIGLAPTPWSDEVGWNADNLLELQFSTVLAEDGRPCLSMNYTVYPIRGYSRLQ